MKKYIPSKYWNERLKKNFNLKGVGNFGYPMLYNRLVYWFKKRMASKFLQNIQVKTVLDIGCGTGEFIDVFKDLDYVGVDISRESVRRLSRNYDCKFYIKDISNFLLKRKFDIVNCFDVLYHIKDDKKFKKALYNISNMTRKYIFITDNFNGCEKDNLKSRSMEEYIENLSDFRLVELKEIPFDFGVKFAVFEKNT